MIITSLLLVPLLQAAPAAQRPFDLMVGDPAPGIQVTEWVQGAPVEKLAPDRTYVVEFWATWCGPCKVAIPHLNELSKKYEGKVQFVGVSVWERLEEAGYTVPAFVQGMGDKMTYTVASDQVKPQDAGFMAKSWMTASGSGGIPTAFIVDDGRIAWIGHPMRIDEPLAQVVAGTFDIDAAAKKYALDMRLKGVIEKLKQDVVKAKKEKDLAGALRILDEAFAKEPSLEANFGLEKYFLLIQTQRAAEAATYGQHLVASVIADNPQALNALAWTLVDPQGKFQQGADYGLAVAAAERAVKLQEGKDASTMDTLGLALFKAGKFDQAIEVQTKALELAKGDARLEPELRARLEQFKSSRKDP
jgi:thiol-disulfide isomerase/thioredoxin